MFGDEVYIFHKHRWYYHWLPDIVQRHEKKQTWAISEYFWLDNQLKGAGFRAKIVEFATFVPYNIARRMWSLDAFWYNDNEDS